MRTFNTADAAQPWCSKCAKHTEGREKILDLLGGEHGPRSYRCNECGKTMWAPVDCRNSGWQGMIIVLFGIGCIIATVFTLRPSLGNVTVYMALLVQGLIVCYVYQRYWKKKQHLIKFEDWTKRKGFLYGS